jgi:hypothetical protein
MDLAAGISGSSQGQTMSAAQAMVLAKSMDLQKMQGQAAVQLIQSASQGGANPGDALAATATGLGGLLDTHA